MNKHRPFKVPENYFEELKDKLQQQINTEKNESKKPFITPDNYFDNLKVELLEIPEKEVNQAQNKVLRLVQRNKRGLVAASVILFVGLIGLYFLNPKIQQNSVTSSQTKYVAEATIYNLFLEDEESLEIPESSVIVEFEEILESNTITPDDLFFIESDEVEEKSKEVEIEVEVAEPETLDEIQAKILSEEDSLDQLVDEILSSEESLFY